MYVYRSISRFGEYTLCLEWQQRNITLIILGMKAWHGHSGDGSDKSKMPKVNLCTLFCSLFPWANIELRVYSSHSDITALPPSIHFIFTLTSLTFSTFKYCSLVLGEEMYLVHSLRSRVYTPFSFVKDSDKSYFIWLAIQIVSLQRWISRTDDLWPFSNVFFIAFRHILPFQNAI